MSKPIAVLISDVHYSLSTLPLADAAFRQAIDKAAELKIPLIDCGDLTNDKAILRAEVVNALIATMAYAKRKGVKVSLIVGNHSLVNEKAKENAINFLSPYAHVVTRPTWDFFTGGFLVPYYSGAQAFRMALEEVPRGSLVIMHQGIQGSNMGHYVQDRSAITKDDVAHLRVISGHYHCRQDIKTGPPGKGARGLFSYVGNPYTLNFGEAKDPSKGFAILHDDGLLYHVDTNLRKHLVFEVTAKQALKLGPTPAIGKEDLLWLKVTGTPSELSTLDKKKMGAMLGVGANYKLDLLPIDTDKPEAPIKPKTESELMDSLIDNTGEDMQQRVYLKTLWRALVS